MPLIFLLFIRLRLLELLTANLAALESCVHPVFYFGPFFM